MSTTSGHPPHPDCPLPRHVILPASPRHEHKWKWFLDRPIGKLTIVAPKVLAWSFEYRISSASSTEPFESDTNRTRPGSLKVIRKDLIGPFPIAFSHVWMLAIQSPAASASFPV